MSDLPSIAWNNLKIPEGSASVIPSKIAAFQSTPTILAFDELWDSLTGVGDIQITNAFWPVLPNLIEPISQLPQADQELAIGQLGWGLALASDVPSSLEATSRDAFMERIAKMAFECLLTSKDNRNQPYLLAAIAACCHLPRIALKIIEGE